MRTLKTHNYFSIPALMLSTLRCSSDSSLPSQTSKEDESSAALKLRMSEIEQRLSVLKEAFSGLAAVRETLESLEDRVATLESRTARMATIRIEFFEFIPDRAPLAGGEDYLIDVEVDDGGNCYAYGRTGHSRFIVPRYLDLAVDRASCEGRTVTVSIYAYWHLDDILIDIDPDPASGRCFAAASPLDPSGCFLTTTYVVGSQSEWTIDGAEDGFLADSYNALIHFQILMLD